MTVRLLALAVIALLLGAAEDPPPEAIIRYCGGGVSGGGGGVRLEPDGTIVRLRRRIAGAPLEETLLAERIAPYAQIAALLDAVGFEAMPRGEPSNMTCSVTRRRNGTSHTVMWGIGRAPAALRPALDAIEAAGR